MSLISLIKKWKKVQPFNKIKDFAREIREVLEVYFIHDFMSIWEAFQEGR